jgi:hypothetical protein
MIALRGIVRQDEEKKWRWTGIWTFGRLPEDEEAALKAKNPSVRPFAYVWDQVRKASDVVVPSASLADEETPDKKEKEKETPDKNEEATESVKEGEEIPPENVVSTTAGDGEPMQVEREDSKAQKEASGGKKEETTTTMTAMKTSEEDESSKAKEMDLSEKNEIDTTEKKEMDAFDKDEVPPTSPATKKKSITFATTFPGEPTFTDAATVHPEKCPPGGAWSGHFETATKRKDRTANQVPENFSLFFNATPPRDARVLFFDDGGEDENSGLLPSGRIHVRGMGSNQYGTWELMGSLDISTGVMECQRMYVKTSEKSPSPHRKKTPSRERRVSIDADGGTTPRIQSTRKRQLSWRKRASLSFGDDENLSSRRSSTSSSKKPRLSNVDRSSVAAAVAMYTPTEMGSPSMPYASSAKRLPAPSPRPLLGAKKRSSQSTKSTSPANSLGVKLPPVGDPNEARWRAAHFLYYRRYDPSDEAIASASGSSNTASFVVYEGEMSHGNCLRDGRGICLYNNGTMYEGEWKRNKEHGRGTLMTADRKRVVYKGEWERGRMHGQGVYYYNEGDHYRSKRKEETSEQQVCRYEGDYKENARHGIGKYVLPDGSVYEGDWRENLMSGRGTFKWPDGSTYVGTWKDGKRNGPGFLKTSDGFVYDGMWVQNAMEGRGIATYPSGQRYEGLWSNGRREGRGTIHFTNGAVYEGRFRDDCMEGQGTMKMTKNAVIPHRSSQEDEDGESMNDWMIPISFQSDMGRIHEKAGFTVEGE